MSDVSRRGEFPKLNKGERGSKFWLFCENVIIECCHLLQEPYSVQLLFLFIYIIGFILPFPFNMDIDKWKQDQVWLYS